MRVLAGDIGGTKTLLQIADSQAGRCRAVRTQRFDSGSYDSLSSIIREFLKDGKNKGIKAACFGIAGPIRETAKGKASRSPTCPGRYTAGNSSAVSSSHGFSSSTTSRPSVMASRHWAGKTWSCCKRAGRSNTARAW